MSSYLTRYVGADRLPRNISDLDVGIYFKLSSHDVEEIHSRFQRGPQIRIAERKAGLAAQLIFLRATGQILDRATGIPCQKRKFNPKRTARGEPGRRLLLLWAEAKYASSNKFSTFNCSRML